MSRRQQVVYLAAAWCLSYPDEELIGRVPLMRAALAEFPGAAADFAEVLDPLESTPPMEIQAHYVREFDLGKRHALHLSYWTDGDTRRRGEVLGNFKKTLPAKRHPGGHPRRTARLPPDGPRIRRRWWTSPPAASC